MLRLLKILWPALIPLLIYGLWCVRRYRKKQRGEAVGPITQGLFLTLLSSLLIAVACFAFLGAQQKPSHPTGYTPTHMEDGKLVPGKLE